MLNLGVSEMLLIAVVSCLVMDPKKIPGTLKYVGMYYRKFQEIKTEVLDAIKGICNGSIISVDGTNDDADYENSTHIYGNDGKLYKRYQIRDILNKEMKGVAPISVDTTCVTMAEGLNVGTADAEVIDCDIVESNCAGTDEHTESGTDGNSV